MTDPSEALPQIIGLSGLSSTNETARDRQGSPIMPVDELCAARIQALAAKKIWSAFPCPSGETVPGPRGTVGCLVLARLSISKETRFKVRAEQGLTSWAFLRTPSEGR